MAIVEFNVSDAQVRDIQRVLNPKQVQKALQVAVIRTTNAALRIATEAVQAKTTIPKKYISSKTNRYAAIRSKITGYADRPIGNINVREVRLPLSAFKHVDTKISGVTIDFGSIDTPLTLRHAFVRRVRSRQQAEMGVSHLAILTRAKVDASRAQRYQAKDAYSKLRAVKTGQVTPKGYAWRLPLQEHFGPTVLDYITKDEIRVAVEKDIGDTFQKNIDSQVSRFTQGQFKSLADAVNAADFVDRQTQDEEPDAGT